jgi:molecular chaperone DnaK
LGRLTGADPEAIESLALFNDRNEVVSVARPDVDDRGELICALEDVPLHRDGENAMRLEFCDVDGDAVHGFDIPMHRGKADAYRPTGSALSNPGVLAKDIYLEVLRDGRSDRQILVSRGTGLPTRETFRFYTADQSGAVVLRLFQNRFPIRTIHLAIPAETDIGSAVDLDLDIDEAMTIVAAGEVAGQKFWAQIEAPPEREAKDWSEIEALLDKADEVERVLWGYESRHFRREITPIVASIRETARTDPDKLQVLVVRLEDVLEDYTTNDAELTPGWGRLVTLLDAIKRNVYQGDGAKQLGLSTEEWIAKLRAIEENAQTVYDARDTDGWSQVFNQVQAIWESLAQEEYRFNSRDPGAHLLSLALSLGREVESLRTMFNDFPHAANPETRGMQEKEIRRLELQLAERVEKPLEALDIEELSPSQAKPELDRLWESASHVRKQFEKVPNLGLVSRG